MGRAVVAISLILVFISSDPLLPLAIEIKNGSVDSNGSGYSKGISTLNFGVRPADWSSDFIAIWRMEESTGKRFSDTSSSCGTDCDLEPSNVSQDTSERTGELSSVKLSHNSSSYLSCDANSNENNSLDDCTDLVIENGDITFGTWIKLNDNFTTSWRKIMGREGGISVSEGYGMYGLLFFNIPIVGCRIDNLLNLAQISEVGKAWSFAACAYDYSSAADPTKERLYAFSAWSKTDLTPSIASTSSSDFEEQTTAGLSDWDGNFYIGDQSSAYGVSLDEAFVIGKALTMSEICRICSCGIRGDLCSCNSTNAAQYNYTGRNETYCGQCTLPNCNATIQ